MTKKTKPIGGGAKDERRYRRAIRVYASEKDCRELERKAELAGLSLSSYLILAGLERPDRKVGG